MSPKVQPLEGFGNYDEWLQSLDETFAALGLETFLHADHRASKPTPADGGFFEWDKARQLAKEIIKTSTVRIAGDMLDAGWNPNAKDPVAHFEFAVKAIQREAVDSGLASHLASDLCRVDRANFASLAAYQSQLQHLKRRLTNLGFCPPEGFLVLVGINGLGGTNRRWARNLEKAVAAEGLDWDGLMLRIWDKAVKEQTPLYSDDCPEDELE